MIELEFSFGESPWEMAIGNLHQGERISGAHLLTLLEEADEDEAASALDMLAQRQITIDIDTLPKLSSDAAAAARLRKEEQLVRQNGLKAGLDENDPLRLYLEEVEQIPLTEEPELLAERLASGDRSVSQLLVDRMLYSAIEIAQTYVGRGVLLLDLIQEASLGLWQGLQSYTGGDIYEYCSWWCRQYLSGAVLLQARAAGVGQKLRQAMEDYRSVDERLLTELGRNPTLAEIADAMHMSVEETSVVADMLDSARLLQRVRQPEPEELPQEEDQAVEDTAYFQMRQRISELLSGLSEQDAKLLTLRYGLEGGLPMDPQQVADRLGITAQDVVAAEAAALAKLRQQN